MDLGNELSGCFKMVKSLFVDAESANETQFMPQGVISPNQVRVIGLIGSGGQANVYRGVYKRREVAIKKFKSDEEIDLVKLSKLLKLKGHRNLINLFGICHDLEYQSYCTGPALVMELCNKSLYTEIHDKSVQINPRDILTRAKEISDGMRHLHKRGIIHRDLKSANILIGYDDTLKISDLDSHTVGTMTNSTVSFQGTVAWMAPELIRHDKCSQKVDIWSFGIILWELLTRQIPYNNWGQSQVMWEVGNNRISTPIPSNCPTQIGAILTSCIDFDTEKRPTFEDISKMIPIAELDMQYMSIQMLNEYRTGWKKEVDTILEKYMECRDESIVKQKEQGLLEINQLKQKLQRHYEKLNKENAKSPEYVFNMMSQLPSSVRKSVIRQSLSNIDNLNYVVSPGSPDFKFNRQNSSRRSRRSDQRRRRQSGIIPGGPPGGVKNESYTSEDNDEMSSEESEEVTSRVPSRGAHYQTATTISRNMNYKPKRTGSNSSSSSDAYSSNSPQSSSDENHDRGIEKDLVSSEEEVVVTRQPLRDIESKPIQTIFSMAESLSADESGFESRNPSTLSREKKRLNSIITNSNHIIQTQTTQIITQTNPSSKSSTI